MPTIICPQLSLVSFQSWWTCLGMTLGMSSFPKKPAFFTFNLAQIDLFLQQRKPIVIGHTGEKVNLLNIHFCLPIQFSLRPDWQCISELLWNPSCVGLLVLAALGITWRAFGYPGARAFRRSMLFCFVLFLETGFLSNSFGFLELTPYTRLAFNSLSCPCLLTAGIKDASTTDRLMPKPYSKPIK